MASFKQELIDAHGDVVESISKLLMHVPVDVDVMNFRPHLEADVLHELIRRLEQHEYYFINGILNDLWDKEQVPWYVGKNQPMVDQLVANHRGAIGLLEHVTDEELLSRTVKTPAIQGTLARVLLHNLDQMSHHRSQLYTYLCLLDVPVGLDELWSK